MPPVFVIFRGPFFPALEHSPIAGQKYCRNAVFLHDGTAAIAIRDGVTDVFQPASAGTVTSVVCGSFRLCSLNRLMNQKQGGYEQQASLETVGENGLATHDFSPENNIWSRIVESAISCRKEKKVTNPERFFSLTTMPPRHHLLCHRFFILFHVGSRESNRLQHPVGHCCQPLRHSVKSRLCLNVDMLCTRQELLRLYFPEPEPLSFLPIALSRVAGDSLSGSPAPASHEDISTSMSKLKCLRDKQ